MLQQNSYRIPRYWRWLKKDYGSDWRLVDVALIFLLMSSNLIDKRIAAIVVAITCLVKIYLIFRKKHKKSLVFTKRVWRIYSVTAILALGSALAVILTTAPREFALGFYYGPLVCIAFMLLEAIFSWAIVIVAVIILMPVEKMINNRYRKEAVDILRSVPGLRIIGITGSYGKTSTKHYLQRILSEKYETLMTPGSYNTPMGVIRTVREQLKPFTEVFICEMGAKQKGDIKEICDLVHPHFGIITAVGPMHLETFGNIETVQSTKFELVDSLPNDGLAVINDDFEYCAEREVTNVSCLRYAVTNIAGADYRAENIVYSPEGTTFDVVGSEGLIMKLRTRLVGECNISNLLGAVVMAKKLGVENEKIVYAVSNIQQVEHRLSIRKTPGGVTIIDDAFNSNPTGSKMALDVLAGFKEYGKRIIITPGMIELGKEQTKLNKEFGRHIGKSVDIAIVVGEYNREAIVAGIKDTEFPEEDIIIADSFNHAQQLLGNILSKGDVVLYENDLPDSFK
ncbi:MAG: UDP-N-acetylmuramoyl-tripeptide--D-alanyl-D-alanine ligase [Muribaculaceae bacterium]|nr:UDP-N-acetylmuramoyl-tripeptide--D-alanyl-D-alanine ligase [Muribaculaceae bacterium]